MTDIAIFLATSGHSGVDRIFQRLVRGFVENGLRVDLLRIRHHGPYFEECHSNLRYVDLAANHVSTAFPALVRYLRRVRPEVLLTDKDRVNRTAILANQAAGKPARVFVRLGTTVSVNLQNRGWWDRNIQRCSMRFLYPAAEKVLVPSFGVAEDLARFSKMSGDHIHTVYNPVIDQMFFQRASQPLVAEWWPQSEDKIILSAGELCTRKDFETLVRAFTRLRQRQNAKLIILGRGKKRESLLKLGRELGVEEDLILPGFQENPYPYLRQASVFVLSSRCEGFGMALAEALALGVPCVSTDCPSGPREILQDGKYGPLVPVGDVDGLSGALEAVLADPPTEDFLRQGADRFTSERAVLDYLSVLGFGRASITE